MDTMRRNSVSQEELDNKIEYLVKRIDEIYDVLLFKKIEEVVEEDITTPFN